MPNQYIFKKAMLNDLAAQLEQYSDDCEPLTILIMQRFIKYVEDFPAAGVPFTYFCEFVAGRKAKRLLAEAVQALNSSPCRKDCRDCKWRSDCHPGRRFEWKHTEEAMKLIEGR